MAKSAILMGALSLCAGTDASAQQSPADLDNLEVKCAPGSAQCTWAAWSIGKSSVALIADIQSAGTFVVCRAAQAEDQAVDLKTVVDGHLVETGVGGGQVGFRGGSCQVLTGKKIYLTIPRAGANSHVIRGLYRRLDREVFTTGYRWSAPRNAKGDYSFPPVLFVPAPILARLCFFTDVTDPSQYQSDFGKSRRVIVGENAYLTFASGAQAMFTPNSCVDLEYPEILIDVDWEAEGNSNVRGALFLPTDPAIP